MGLSVQLQIYTFIQFSFLYKSCEYVILLLKLHFELAFASKTFQICLPQGFSSTKAHWNRLLMKNTK